MEGGEIYVKIKDFDIHDQPFSTSRISEFTMGWICGSTRGKLNTCIILVGKFLWVANWKINKMGKIILKCKIGRDVK